MSSEGLYIALISVHGLIRARDPELGRDADTGGQVLYVLDLARALARHPDVERVDLLTRLVEDQRLGADYARPHELLAPGAHLVRLPCGPRRYLRKESLWPHLGDFIDRALQHFRLLGRLPDAVHGHYADAGWVATRLSAILDLPLVQTGHSLGRVKKQRLEASGMEPEAVERRYNITRRIEAEEATLEAASLVVASTEQEVEEQYALYDHYVPERMRVLPPGVDLSRFQAPDPEALDPPIAAALARFLRAPEKPMVLTLARADRRKNLVGLVEAFGRRPELRERANLVVVAGNRDDLRETGREPRRVLRDLLYAIDRHDLYGHAAYPKHHDPEDVPALYQLATRRRGLFVNPAFTEPFGLTLIEAAASGLPLVATDDGGPREILARCENGLLVDPMDEEALAATLLDALSDPERWERWSQNGLLRVAEHYSWDAHVSQYLAALGEVLAGRSAPLVDAPSSHRLFQADRMLISDIDNTLLGDREGLAELLARIGDCGRKVAFGVATGRKADSALEILEEWGVPTPDVVIAAVGSEIYYGSQRQEDLEWLRRLDHRWDRKAILELLADIPGIELQEEREQGPHKVSYYVDPEKAPSIPELETLLRSRGVAANVIFSHGEFLDILPVRASKGGALRYLSLKWNLPVDRILVAGDSGNDEEMLRGETLGVVVGNYSEELAGLQGARRIYFAQAEHAAGIVEGAEHYGFFAELRFAEDEAEEDDPEETWSD